MLPSSFKPFSIRNLRTRSASGKSKSSRDQFTATLVRAGFPVANISSLIEPFAPAVAGYAGEPDHILSLAFESQAEAKYFQDTVAAIRADSELGRAFRTLELDGLDPAEGFIYALAYATYLENRLSEHCGRFTLYRLPTDADNAWKMVKAPYRVALAKKIRREHPDALIANELLKSVA